MEKIINCPSCKEEVKQITDYGMFGNYRNGDNNYSWVITKKWYCNNCGANFKSELCCFSKEQPKFWENYEE